MEVLTVVTAIAAAVAALASTALIWVSLQQMKANQVQAQASQEQVRLATQAQYDAHRPLVSPYGKLPTVGGQLDGTVQDFTVRLNNLGGGVALNVVGVIYGPEPPATEKTGGSKLYLWRLDPLPNGRAYRAFGRQGGFSLSGDAEIGDERKCKLFAPKEPSLGELMLGHVSRKIARVTVTYHDMFNLKHASVFDYTDQDRWEFVAFLPNILEDLTALEAKHAASVPTSVAAYQPPSTSM